VLLEALLQALAEHLQPVGLKQPAGATPGALATQVAEPRKTAEAKHLLRAVAAVEGATDQEAIPTLGTGASPLNFLTTAPFRKARFYQERSVAQGSTPTLRIERSVAGCAPMRRPMLCGRMGRGSSAMCGFPRGRAWTRAIQMSSFTQWGRASGRSSTWGPRTTNAWEKPAT